MSRRLLTMDELPERAITCRSSSCNIVSSNGDLMVNILSRLPVKALSRFRCVSKQWNMLISDPYFVSAHRAQAAQDPNIMKVLWVDIEGPIRVCSIQEKEETVVTLDLIQPNILDAFPLEYAFVEMVGRPCNGLICLVVGRETLVCNPATRNCLLLPRYNERDQNSVRGLGFCSSSNEFKVVRLFERYPEENDGWYGCELFTVAQRGARRTNHLQPSRSWRYVGNLPCEIPHPLHEIMCYANGRVHWITKSVSSPMTPSTSNSEFIVSLDLELEEFKVVSYPEHWPKHVEFTSEHHLIELGGKLCAVAVLTLELFDIWVLEDYTISMWSKKYHIDIGECPYFIFPFSVIAICRGRLLLVINNAVIYLCDPRNNFLEEVIEVETGFWNLHVGTYVESLYIPD